MKAMEKRLANAALAVALAAGGALAGPPPAAADGGVTFTNVAAGGGAGIAYERFGNPARMADMQTFYDQGVDSPLTFQVLAETPQKPRGSPGVALLDYDADGDVDIYVPNGPGHANSLYRNELIPSGALSFVDVAAAAGVAATAQDSGGVCYGDVDNDGFEDLYVTGIGEPNLLFLNNGDGTFSDITVAAGAGGGNLHTSSCALADFNGDGYLDILAGNTYSDWMHRRPVFLSEFAGPEANQLLLRRPEQPGIRFEDVSVEAGLHDLGPWANLDGATFTWGLAAVDYDRDGDVDMMWADVNGPPPAASPEDDQGWIRVLRNDGTGHFTDVTQAAGLAKTGIWMGLGYGDFNCDSAMDVFVTNLGDYVGGPFNQTRWFLGDGAGGFTDPGFGAEIQASVFGWGTAVMDYDNDGDQDLFYYGDDDLLNVVAMDNPGTVVQNHGCRAEFSYDRGALLTDHRLREVNGVAGGDLNNDGWQDVVSVAMFRIVPVTTRLFPFTFITGPLDPVLDSVAQVLFVMARTAASPTRLVLLPGLNEPNGDLAVEINSGGLPAGSVKVRTLGTFGLTAGGRTNRDGIGAVLAFTPDGGPTVLSPVVGGGSHASQESRIRHFGLGPAAQGTVQVDWPGGLRNVLYDVKAGETVDFPEIPCDYRASSWKNFGLFNACVTRALDELRQAGKIDQAARERFRASAWRAFGQQP